MNRLVATLENAVKISGALAVLGYMSLRAHHNFIGIPSGAAGSLSLFLMETYLFAAAALIHLITNVALIAIFLLPVVGLTLLVRNRPLGRRSIAAAGNAGGWLRVSTGAQVLGLAFSVLLIAGMLRSLSGTGDVGVGVLHASTLAEPHAWSFDIALVALVLIGSWHVFGRASVSDKGTSGRRALHVAITFALTLATALLPVLYGRVAHPSRYPVAQVVSKRNADQALCGLVVSSTPEHLILWSPVTTGTRTAGVMRLYPIDELHEVAQAELLDLIVIARESIEDPLALGRHCSRLQLARIADSTELDPVTLP